MADHILVATDLSKRSDLALVRAKVLGALWKARVTILHVVDEDQPAELVRYKIEQAKAYLEKTLTEQTAAETPATEVIVKAGDVHQTINKTAKEKGSKLIIMGAHRRNIILDVFRGTSIERVLHTGTTPVLMVVRETGDGYDTAIFGADMDEFSRHAIDTAHNYHLIDSARLTVAHAYSDLAKVQMAYVGTDSEEIRKHVGEEHNRHADQVYNFLAQTKLGDSNYRLILEETDPAQLILKVAADLDADLIVIGTRSAAGLKKLVLGSTAASILRHAHSDVLVVPPLRA